MATGADMPPHLTGALGLWTWDLANERVRGDARFAALLGLDPGQARAGIAAADLYARVHPEDRLRLRIAVAGVAQGAEVFAREFRVTTTEGVRWVQARSRVEHVADRRPQSFSGVLTDVTEQKRVEDRLDVAQSAGGVGTFEFVDGFGTVDVSDQFCRLLGLRVADTLSVRTINATVEPGDPPLIGGVSNAEPTFRSEVRIRRADTGEPRWLAIQGERRIAADDAGPTTVGAIYDITAAKAAEAQLRELAATLEQRVEARTQERDRLWSTSRDLFGVVGQDGVLRAANPAWLRLLGYEDSEVVGRSFLDFVQADDLAAAGRMWSGGDAAVALEDLDVRMRARDGAWKWVNWTVIPQGEAFYAVGRDVTERKQLEQQLRQSQKMEAVGQLTGGIAHDFNNMLTGILGGLDMVQRRLASGKPAEAQRFIQGAIASAERAAALTHRLLAFSRQQTLDPSAVDANGLVLSMEDLLRRTLGERIDLAIELDPGLWSTVVDANQLESALLNLAINARDAMPDGGKLTIETVNVQLAAGAQSELAPGDYVQLSVSDTGTGMSPDVMGRVFDPFFTTKPLGQGTGLGLSMVFGFARQSGGDVTIYSELGRGTTVRLYLPRHLGEAPAAEPKAAAPAPRGAGETVLVVEDDPAVRPVVVELLRDLGYVALDVSGAEDALAILQSQRRVDLMVSDIGLPGLNGRQLAELARDVRPDLPVLFMTGYAAGASRRSDFLGPGMEMISKPFAAETLAQKIRAMVAAQSPGTAGAP
ncbi:PAS domain-containing sensor histidine kinase [Phenylobacterium sp. J367]|uniref:hybrid sensor histidine kinase/response regulator n=1 Tax=Phenylobacterium sp. J367 TaxID=2898435 RepID=UPI002150F652|nr:PAS domain S-box protein [Phenylobacterium sp. J367]MCR5881117.1 PAS domain S-box protein [Phenylobacterium sp. J367]